MSAKLSSEEKRNRRVGLIVSLLLHIALVLAFIFTFAWLPPNPPPPELGIELALGNADEGSGKMPDLSNAAASLKRTQESPAEESNTKPTEEAEPVSNENPEAIPVVEEKKQEKPKTETKPIKTQESTQKNTEKPQNTKDDGKKTNDKALMQGDGKGDDGKAGSKGKEEGSPDGRGLYSSGGQGGTDPFSVKGWRLNCNIAVNDRSGETGRIVFNVEIDDQGYLAGLSLREANVSPAVVKLYEKAVQNQIENCLEKKGDKVEARAKGTLTFVLTNKR
jgi:outer membrane biosynthesis protein TonB